MNKTYTDIFNLLEDLRIYSRQKKCKIICADSPPFIGFTSVEENNPIYYQINLADFKKCIQDISNNYIKDIFCRNRQYIASMLHNLNQNIKEIFY